MTNSEHVRDLVEERSNAMAAKDIERLMALYSDDVVYFDLVPPLRYSGADALRARSSTGSGVGRARSVRRCTI